MNINRLRKWLIFYWLLITGMNLNAQPQVQTFIFPDKDHPDQWQVDLYIHLPQELISQPKMPNQNTLNLILQVYDENGNRVLNLSELIDPDLNQNEILFSNEIPGFEHSKRFSIPSGPYQLELLLQNAKGKELIKYKSQLHIPGQSQVKLSDLVPVSFPKISSAPFERILWPEIVPLHDDFYLYYEVVTSVPDTLLQFQAQLENQQGEVIRDETYSLIISNYWKWDYFWVKVNDLPSGTYIFKLMLKNTPLIKEFKFRVVNTPVELTGRGEDKVS
ncbi:MAG: hypothetical protein D6813_01255 [Calditrichaeota bacterium]|nr:MAG: hypothetical protein D6813_01255 [Calditrichota bacterium]